jgi:hypothetical protein
MIMHLSVITYDTEFFVLFIYMNLYMQDFRVMMKLRFLII